MFNLKFLINKIILAAIFLVLTGSALAADSEIIYDQCYLVKSKGTETGYTCITQKKNDNVIVTEKHIIQRFKRGSENVEISQDQAYVENEAGKPVGFSFISKNPGESIEIKGEFDWLNSEITINSKVNNIKETQILPIEQNIIFPYAIDRLYRESKYPAINYTTIEPGINANFLKVTSTVVPDADPKLKKYKLGLSIFPNATMYEWRDSNGRLVKSTNSIMDLEKVAVDKKEIVNLKTDFNVFPESLVKVTRSVDAPGALSEAIFKVTAKDLPVEKIFLFDDNQSLEQLSGNTAYIKVKADRHNNKYPYPVEISGFEEYLKSGPYIMTNSYKIQEVANKLKEGETDAVKIATSAERWVYNNITNKNMSVDFGNAIDTLESASGDCTEHSVLLASILRTLGIPAKVVVGLVYTNTPDNALVYHMWVKAYTGKWINLDPSQPYSNFSPLHLAMAESPMNNLSAKTDLVLDIIDNFSKMEIEILNASKPIVTEIMGRPEIIISLNSKDLLKKDNYIDVVISKPDPTKSAVQEIKIATSSDSDIPVDNLKAAFFSFSIGDTEGALNQLKEYYKNIAPDDDYARIKLAMKLINMSYFNFASKVLGEIKDKTIWGPLVDELHALYFPKIMMTESTEDTQVNALYLLNYKNQSEQVLEKTGNFQAYDYIHYLRARAYKDLKQFDNAEKEINTAVNMNRDSLAYKLEQVNILSSANKLGPAHLTLYALNLDAIRLKIKNKEFWKTYQSYDYWLKVKEFKDNVALSKYNEAYYYYTKGELELAADILTKLIKHEKQAYVFELLGDVYYELEMYDAAKNTYEKTLVLDGYRVKSYIGLGNIYFITGNNQLAEKYYKEATEKFPRNIDALLAMAKLYAYQGQNAKSYECFKKILSMDKNNTDVLYNLGLVLAHKGKYNDAEKFLKRALSANPMQSLIWLDLAKLEIARKDYKLAENYLKNVNYIDEHNPYYYYFMGVIAHKNNQEDQAKKYFKKAISLKPGLADELKEANKPKEKPVKKETVKNQVVKKTTPPKKQGNSPYNLKGKPVMKLPTISPQ